MKFRWEGPHRADTAGHRLRSGSAQTMSSSIGEFWPTKWLLGGRSAEVPQQFERAARTTSTAVSTAAAAADMFTITPMVVNCTRNEAPADWPKGQLNICCCSSTMGNKKQAFWKSLTHG